MDRASPYQGLDAFGEGDWAFFFGRSRDIRIIVANAFASPLTLLYGPSGVGKSSVLQAGVIPQLREREGVSVVVLRSWAADPALVLRRAVTEVEAAHRTTGRRVAIVLDQFEDYFLYRDEDDPFVDEIADAVTRDDIPLSMIVSIREDVLAKLDRFETRVTGLFDATLRLDHLGRAAGQEAIVGPRDRWNERAEPPDRFQIEPDLVKAVLDGVPAAPGRVETALLQLVMARLWDERGTRGPFVLRLDTFVGLGRVGGIVDDHVDGTLDALTPERQELAAAILDRLVTPSRIRVAQRATDLAGWAEVSEAKLVPLLEQLSAKRILRPAGGAEMGQSRYEVRHDSLADAVLRWRTRFVTERTAEAERARSRRKLRLAIGGLIAAVVLALVLGGLLLYAVAQRQTARSQAYSASANGFLDTYPARGLQFALAAVGERETEQAEDALRSALAASHERVVLEGHAGPVTSASFSRNGAAVVTGGHDGTVRLWSAASAQQIDELHRSEAVVSTAYCPSADRLLVAETNGVWIVERGDELMLGAESMDIDAAACSSDGSRVATVSAGGLRVFDARTGTELPSLPGADIALLSSVALSADGSRVAAAGHAGVTVWTIASRGILAALEIPDGFTSVALAPDGPLVALGTESGTVLVWDSVRDVVRELTGHTNAVTSLDFGLDAKVVASASADRTARIWDVTSRAELAVLRGHERTVRSIDIAVDGRSVVTAGDDERVRLWAMPIRALLPTDGAATAVVVSRDGRRVAIAAKDGGSVWDLLSGRRLRSLGELVVDVAISDDGTRAATLDTVDGTVRGWSLDGRAPPTVIGGKGALSMDLDPSGTLIAVARNNGSVRIFPAANGPGRVLLRPSIDPAVILEIAFSPKGERLAVGTLEGDVRVLDVESGSVVARLESAHEGLEDVEWSSDGRLLATAGGDNAARIWDSTTGELKSELVGHEDIVTSASFSADGRMLATGSADGTTRIWDARTAVPIAIVSGRDVAVAADGETVVVAGPGATAHFRTCDYCGALAELRDRGNARSQPLQDSERQRYVG
jgi:WD40 repeat protein